MSDEYVPGPSPKQGAVVGANKVGSLDHLVELARQEVQGWNPIGGMAGAATTPATAARISGAKIGDYTIARELGRGGFGVVYEAQQDNPRRAVALKVIRGGQYIDEHHVKLFQREAQALARLRHHCIGAIYEAGRTEDGQHYFAMELVHGRPLTEHVQQAGQSIRQRLQLFNHICEAIHYAHQKGVMHRDLKPSNILIDADDNPKILDFGLAKITEADVSVTTVLTEVGRIAGTLPYMSPEQARGRADEIDIRSDVYSLGVILYELLTGSLPYDVTRVMPHEAVRIICEQTPRRPSSILRVLRGDLETITLKALEKEPRRRYASAVALSEDIHRYLTDQPILARPPSATYQFRKLVARHKVPFGFATALFIVLIAFSIWMSVLYRAQLRERKRTEEQRTLAEQRQQETQQVADFQARMLSQIDSTDAGLKLMKDIRDRFEAALAKSGAKESDRALRAQTLRTELALVNASDTAVALIDQTILKPALSAVESQFRNQPLVDAALRQTLAESYFDLGRFDDAMALQEQALVTRRRVLGEDHPDTLASINSMGILLEAQGKVKEAEPYSREAMEMRRRVLGEEHPDTLASIGQMSTLLQAQGKYDQAEQYSREVLEKARRVLGEEHPDTLAAIADMGMLLHAKGQFDQAEPYNREALEKRRRVLGEEHPQTLVSIGNMGFLLQAEGKLEKGEPYSREALEKSRRVLGEEHPNTLAFINNLGFLFQSQGKLEEAEPYYREVLEKCRRVLGEDHPHTLGTIANIGTLLQAQGKLDHAEAYYREALEKRRRVLGNEHPDTLISISQLGGLLVARRKYAEGISLLAPADPAERQEFMRGNVLFLGQYLTALGRCRAGTGDFRTAEANLIEAQAIISEAKTATHKHRDDVLVGLVELYDAWHSADPDKGYDAKVAKWRAKLAAYRATTQPVTTQSARIMSTTAPSERQ